MNKGANLKFSRTASLGTVAYKGQRALVIDAIAKTTDPFTRDQVVEVIDKEAYEKTFQHGTQIVTIPESVQYHLRELTKREQLVEIPSPLPVIKSNPRNIDLGPIMDGRMSRAAVTESIWATNGSDADIRNMAREWYGYGRWDSQYWFIGQEPGMDPAENNDLKQRCDSWVELGAGELVDCKEHHFGFGCYDWHREFPPPLLQSTWKQLIRLLLAYRSGKEPSIQDILSYQQRLWGMKNGETCVIEMCSLAANKLKVKKAISFDPDIFRAERIGKIRRRIDKYKPKLVLMYGLRDTQHFQEIAGRPLVAGDPVKTRSTCIVHTPAPAARGLENVYWLQLAKKLREYCGF